MTAPSVPPDPASSSSGPRAIVAGHGAFAEGMLSAVALITGRSDRLIPLSNAGLGREEIESRLRELLLQHGARVVFTDLPAGSATLAARRIMHDQPALTLVAGVNLATLVDFVFRDDSISPRDAAEQAAEKGRAAMVVIAGRAAGTGNEAGR